MNLKMLKYLIYLVMCYLKFYQASTPLHYNFYFLAQVPQDHRRSDSVSKLILINVGSLYLLLDHQRRRDTVPTLLAGRLCIMAFLCLLPHHRHA